MYPSGITRQLVITLHAICSVATFTNVSSIHENLYLSKDVDPHRRSSTHTATYLPGTYLLRHGFLPTDPQPCLSIQPTPPA